MSPDDPPPPHDAPASGAARCEASFEKRYEMKDRLARGLFTALCRSLNVDAYTLTKSSTAPIYVRADAPTHADRVSFLVTDDALWIANTGRALSEEDVLAHCGQVMASFKAPKRVVLVDALPKNPSGKLLKRQLREQYAGLLADAGK